MKKQAFTLAEVLITLGIIGVVAAMTIPILMTAYRKKQTVTRLKRAYSIVQQSIRLSEDENGEVESWDTKLNGDEFFKTYLANYIKYLDKYTSQELWDKAPRKILTVQITPEQLITLQVEQLLILHYLTVQWFL